ncbi:hypothetical protein QOT17_013336 [Balamuthia mandrillaris]
MEDHTPPQKLSVADFVRLAKEVETLKLQMAQKDRQQEKEIETLKLQLAQKDRQKEKAIETFQLHLAQKDQEIAGLKQTVLLSALGNKTDAAVSEWLDKVETVISSKELEKFLPPVSDGVFPSRKTKPPTRTDKEDIHQNFLRDICSELEYCCPGDGGETGHPTLQRETSADTTLADTDCKAALSGRILVCCLRQQLGPISSHPSTNEPHGNSGKPLDATLQSSASVSCALAVTHCGPGKMGKKCGQGLHYLLRVLYASPEDLGFELEKAGEQVRLWLEPVVKESILVECIFRGILQEQASVFSITRRNHTPTVLKRCQRNRSRHQGSLTKERQVMVQLGLQSTSPDGGKVKRLRMPLLLNHYVQDKYEALEMWPVGEETLEQWCRREVRRFNDLLKLFKQVEEALRAAHLKEILHSDVKPSNIILWASSTNPSASLQAVLIDWACHKGWTKV